MIHVRLRPESDRFVDKQTDKLCCPISSYLALLVERAESTRPLDQWMRPVAEMKRPLGPDRVIEAVPPVLRLRALLPGYWGQILSDMIEQITLDWVPLNVPPKGRSQVPAKSSPQLDMALRVIQTNRECRKLAIECGVDDRYVSIWTCHARAVPVAYHDAVLKRGEQATPCTCQFHRARRPVLRNPPPERSGAR